MNCCSANRFQTNNPLCAHCIVDHVEVSGDCVYCTRTNHGAVFGLLLLAFIFIGLFHRISQTPSNDINQQVFYYFQMILLFFGPESGWISWLSFINFNILGSSKSCIIPLTPIQRFLSDLILPIIGLAQLIIVIIIEHGLIRLNKRCSSRLLTKILPVYATSARPLVRALLAYGLSSYTSIATCVWDYFTCIDVMDNDRRLQSYPAVSCNSSEYRDLSVMFIVIAIIITIMPLITLMVLIRNYLHGKLANEVHQLRYGVLFQQYKHRRYWWVLVDIARRVAFIALCAQLAHRRQLMFTWLTVVNIMMLVLQVFARPYVTESSNTIETLILTVHATITAIMTTASFPLSSHDASLIALLVFIPGTCILCYMAYHHLHKPLHHVWRRGRARLGTTSSHHDDGDGDGDADPTPPRHGHSHSHVVDEAHDERDHPLLSFKSKSFS